MSLMNFSIPPISRERVLELVERIHPLVERDEKLWHIAPCDPWKIAFSWDPTLRRPALDFVPGISFPTLHTYGAPVFFKPSIAEVLAQIPEELIDEVDAFSVKGPDTAADLNKNIDALNAGFHVATTTLYKRTRKESA